MDCADSLLQTVYFTLVFHGKSRKGQELEDRFGDSLERMTAVTDRHSAYFALHFLNHQVCLAHLLRECQYLNELDKEQQWSKSVESLLQGNYSADTLNSYAIKPLARRGSTESNVVTSAKISPGHHIKILIFYLCRNF